MNFMNIFLTIGCICTAILGQYKDSVNQDVYGFINNIGNSETIKSSELRHGRAHLFKNMNEKFTVPMKLKGIENSNSPVSWKKRTFSSFNVKYPKVDNEIRTYFKSNIQDSNLTVESREYDGNADSWVISIPEHQERELYAQNWSNNLNLSLEELKKIGIKHLRNNFKQFSGQLEYLTSEVEYELINDQNVITQVSLRFARRFHGGIVLGNIAYIYIVIDGRGNLMRVKIKWPMFEESQPVENVKSFNSTLEDVESFCQKGKHLKVWGNIDSIQPNNVAITGAARAWVPENNKGQILITPAISYSVSLKLKWVMFFLDMLMCQFASKTVLIRINSLM